MLKKLKAREKIFKWILLASLVLVLTSCASNKGPIDPKDPYEHINRKIFDFNMALDKALFRPVAKTYNTVFPWPVKKGVYNFFNNIGDVTSAANEVLQLDFPQTISDLARVFINTIVGVGGLFDVATYLGVERNASDFGLTLAYWGSGDTPYIVLPFFGPYTLRDAVGFPINYFLLNPWSYIKPPSVQWVAAGLYHVQHRASLLIADEVVDQAFDSYVFIRDTYLQHREFLINKNNERRADHL